MWITHHYENKMFLNVLKIITLNLNDYKIIRISCKTRCGQYNQLLDTVPSNLFIKPNIIQNHNAQSISIKNQIDAL